MYWEIFRTPDWSAISRFSGSTSPHPAITGFWKKSSPRINPYQLRSKGSALPVNGDTMGGSKQGKGSDLPVIFENVTETNIPFTSHNTENMTLLSQPCTNPNNHHVQDQYLQSKKPEKRLTSQATTKDGRLNIPTELNHQAQPVQKLTSPSSLQAGRTMMLPQRLSSAMSTKKSDGHADISKFPHPPSFSSSDRTACREFPSDFSPKTTVISTHTPLPGDPKGDCQGVKEDEQRGTPSSNPSCPTVPPMELTEKSTDTCFDPQTIVLDSDERLNNFLDGLTRPQMPERRSSSFWTVLFQPSSQLHNLSQQAEILILDTVPTPSTLCRLRASVITDQSSISPPTSSSTTPRLFPRVNTIHFSTKAMADLYLLLASDDSVELMEDFSLLANPVQICLNVGWYPSSEHRVRKAVITLRQRWSRLESINFHQVSSDLPFFLPGVLHQAHWTSDAWPFVGESEYVTTKSYYAEEDEFNEDFLMKREMYPYRYVEKTNKMHDWVEWMRGSVDGARRLEIAREEEKLRRARLDLKRYDRETLCESVARCERDVGEAEWAGKTRWVITFPKLEEERGMQLCKVDKKGVMERVEFKQRKGRAKCEACGWKRLLSWDGILSVKVDE
ncbi:hypothetical protein TREMEDRAFT_62228 [Tremella mesenterica DSM 1558]|uniref:uncharacterized protein n=1 Tax=Tremella mesenterica (strain ATCC 24925 / CBS 8224 / DSM 1558 / NBRC 9311 / NRRL Y-6157 / RJB 2259-6 / UBC 559-6) TaxID=578456 RepID=UPI0003F4A24A|nr:uncharacterized protein TREMEDRAFT_62228 [Tremella mesenterica DSM 1558]EIW69363.1 hypothetical protein TREMEDRAFT_62228 [Tremella mesenterica DSM 1558]